MSKRTVFICRDFMLDYVLDGLSAKLEQAGIEVIRGEAPKPGVKLKYAPDALARAEVAMFSSRSICTREMMTNAPKLRGIVNPTIGLETVDTDAASELGIIVGHGATPENFNSMAEVTVMLILMMMYQPKQAEAVMQGRRERPNPRPEEAWARMMMKRTIGLVGLGRIARGVVERLAGWQLRILAHDPFVKPENVPAGVTMTDLDTVMKESDVVSVLVAVTPDNVGMIGAREFALMKPDAYLVNTSRGAAINERAMYEVLRDKRIAGAALDTFEVEPLPADSPLRTLDNVILTPHVVGHTKDVYASFIPAAFESITRILKGELPVHCKNPEIAPKWRARLPSLGTGNVIG